jgi:Domain of unknown function (DUF3303)
MALFLSIISHGAAECATHNEYYRKATLEGMSQMEELAKKHGVKIVGAWSVHSKHFQVIVYDVPNFEALMAFSMEPPMKKAQDMYDIDVWPAMNMQEVAQMLMQA